MRLQQNWLPQFCCSFIWLCRFTVSRRFAPVGISVAETQPNKRFLRPFCHLMESSRAEGEQFWCEANLTCSSPVRQPAITTVSARQLQSKKEKHMQHHQRDQQVQSELDF
eukprot:gene11976-biopygen3280